jgi:hypothetical protein
LPSIVDLLGAEVDWEFDGHSLYDGSKATVEPQVSTDVAAVLDIARKRAEEFPYGDDWIALAAVGPNGDLVGREVADVPLGTPSEFTVSIDQQSEFAQVPSRDLELPYAISGRVDGPAQPPELLAAINGRIAGVIGGYRPAGEGWEFIGYLADLYRLGHNEVAVYEVSRSGDAVTLHPVEPHDFGPAQRNAQL